MIKIFRNFITCADKKFIDLLFEINDVIPIEVDRLNNEDFNRYYIKIARDSISELVEKDISRAYIYITNNKNYYYWDIIDKVYKNDDELCQYKRNTFYKKTDRRKLYE